MATQPLAEILARIEALPARNAADDLAARGMVLGKERVPAVMLSRLFEQYETLAKSSRQDLSPDQLRTWGNPKKRALANLLIGDRLGRAFSSVAVRACAPRSFSRTWRTVG